LRAGRDRIGTSAGRIAATKSEGEMDIVKSCSKRKGTQTAQRDQRDRDEQALFSLEGPGNPFGRIKAWGRDVKSLPSEPIIWGGLSENMTLAEQNNHLASAGHA